MKAKHRFFTNKITQGGYAFVEGREVHHARKVLRLGEKDPVIVFNEAGEEFLGEVVKYHSKEKMEIRLLEELERNVESKKNLVLVMSLCRSKNFEIALQKCIELGISAVIPLETEFSILKIDDAEKKNARWKDIALDATKQSTRTLLPEIFESQTFETLFENFDLNGNNTVMATVSEKQNRIKNLTEKLKDSNNIFMIIGPEGGFSPSEVKLAEEKGLNIVTLGKRILRAETAAIFLTSVLVHELDL